MLSKAQKVVMYIIGFIAIVIGILTCIPFRTIAGNASVENIYLVEATIKLIGFPLLAILLVIIPNQLKYRQIYDYEERSKVVNVFCYLPIVIVISSLLVLSLHTLTFEQYPTSNVGHSIMLVVFACYLVLSCLLLPLLMRLTMKLSRKYNYLLDLVVLLLLVVTVLLTWKILKIYSNANLSGYVYGASQYDPYLFVLLIGLFFAAVLGTTKLIKFIKANETIVYANTLTKERVDEIVKEQYDRAYNDLLDEFEDHFDNEVIDDEEDEDDTINEQEEANVPNQVKTESNDVENLGTKVENQDDSSHEVIGNLNDLHHLLEETDNANDEKRAEQAEQIKAQIEAEKNALDAERNELEAYRVQIAEEIAALETQINEFEDVVEETVEVTPTVKKKVFKPTFEQIVTFAKSLQEDTWKIQEKINEENGNGTIKFSKGKIQFLILQKTNSDYRITFMVTEKKWSTIYTTVKGISVPKNAKGNNLLKYVNKGVAETSLIKSFIRESVKAVNAEIARIEKEKEEEKKRKAEAKKLARQQAKLAEKNDK